MCTYLWPKIKKSNTCLQQCRKKRKVVITPQCGNFKIFRPFKFYVKSIFVIPEVSKNFHLNVFKAKELEFDDFLQFVKAEICPKVKFRASTTSKLAGFELSESLKVDLT